ncbi:hypothetical protein CSW58_12635 [Caulobacter sp. B11]|nr:hypothetical protein CSW58_12635 [Caulobacter sp. B11]
MVEDGLARLVRPRIEDDDQFARRMGLPAIVADRVLEEREAQPGALGHRQAAHQGRIAHVAFAGLLVIPS